MQAALKSWERPLADFQQGQGCQFYDCKALDSTNNPREPGNRFSTAAAAAAAAKSLQSCPTLCDPIDGKPTRLPHPWDSPGKNTGAGCHFLLQCIKVKVKLLSRVRLLVTSWTAAYQAPLSTGLF